LHPLSLLSRHSVLELKKLFPKVVAQTKVLQLQKPAEKISTGGWTRLTRIPPYTTGALSQSLDAATRTRTALEH